MTTKAKQPQLIGTCPACHDKLMAFEPLTNRIAMCGGCGCEVSIAEVMRDQP